MRQVSHSHCVQLLGSYTDIDHINILSFLVADMDLAAFLGRPIHDKECRTLCQGVGCLCNAIHYLQQNNIRHKDLKSQNVLIHGDIILISAFSGTSLSELEAQWKHTSNGQSNCARNLEAVIYGLRELVQHARRDQEMSRVIHMCDLIRLMLNHNRLRRLTSQKNYEPSVRS
jgi:hypothetical protein